MLKVSRRRLMAGAASVAGLATLGAGGLAGRRLWLDREPKGPPAQNTEGRLVWRNWSGTEHAYPRARLAPRSETELAEGLKRAPGPIRPVGSGHSFTGLASTDGALITLDGMTGLVSHDPISHRATVRAGTRLAELGAALAKVGQEMPNLPDINKQSLAGALGTGTHGTGRGIKALHGEVLAFRLVTPDGEILTCDAASHRDVFQAARVGLGAFGVITEVTLQNRPLTRVRKRVALQPLEEVLDGWEQLRLAHRNAEFLVLPFTGHAAVITHDETTDPLKPRGPDTETQTLMSLKQLRDVFEFVTPARIALARRLLADVPAEEMVDEGWKLLSNERPVRFKEMEYHLPIDAQIPALREVIAAIETHRPDVFFPIEARVIAPDDAWLSPFYGRESGSVAVHAYYKEDHDFFFSLIEPIFRRYDGRPHWGKLNSLRARDFATLYPRWRDAMEVRRALDGQDRMLNDYLKRALVDDV